MQLVVLKLPVDGVILIEYKTFVFHLFFSYIATGLCR